MKKIYLVKQNNHVEAFFEKPTQYDMIVSESEWIAAGCGAYIESNKIILGKPDIANYVEKRQCAYPRLAEQLDMIYWDIKNKTHLWTEKIDSIKKLYPKN